MATSWYQAFSIENYTIQTVKHPNPQLRSGPNKQAACSVSAQEVKVERFLARWAWLKIQELGLGLRRF